MTSSTNPEKKKILKGANIDGIVFCTPSGEIEKENPIERQEKQNLSALEEFWKQKGFKEGFKKGQTEGVEKGQTSGFDSGYQKGLQEGTEKGLEEGFENGKKETSQEFETSYRESLELLETLSSSLKEKKVQFLNEIKPEVIQFCTQLSETLLRRELSNKEQFSQLIESLLKQIESVAAKEAVQLILSPCDYKLFQDASSQFSYNSEKIGSIELVEDANLSRGDCRVEAELGLVNFDIKRILLELEHKALEVRDAESNPEMGELIPDNLSEFTDQTESVKPDALTSE